MSAPAPTRVFVDVIEPGKALVTSSLFTGRAVRENSRLRVEVTESDTLDAETLHETDGCIGHTRSGLRAQDAFEQAGRMLADKHGLADYVVEIDVEY